MGKRSFRVTTLGAIATLQPLCERQLVNAQQYRHERAEKKHHRSSTHRSIVQKSCWIILIKIKYPTFESKMRRQRHVNLVDCCEECEATLGLLAPLMIAAGSAKLTLPAVFAMLWCSRSGKKAMHAASSMARLNLRASLA